MLLTADQLRRCIIDWAGERYNPRMVGNPDYLDDEDVDALVIKILGLQKH